MIDHDVHERLIVAGGGFRDATIDAPSLDVAAETVTRPRGRPWLWPAVAAVAVLIIATGVLLSVDTRGRRDPTGGPAPASITSGGRRLVYLGTVPWSSATLDKADPTVVFVSGHGSAMQPTCQATAVARVVSETSSTVRVAITVYGDPGSSPVVWCPRSLRVQLSRALDGRDLVDAETGMRRPVLSPVPVPTLHY